MMEIRFMFLYNGSMKRFIFLCLMLVIVLNSFAVSAWAASCPQSEESHASHTEMEMVNGADIDMPCPMMDDGKSGQDDVAKADQSPFQHCEGVCLCLHASLSQNVMPASDPAVFDIYASELINPKDDRTLVSLNHLPPRKPPKFSS